MYSVFCKIADLTDTRGPCSLMEICKCFLKRRNLFALLLITLKIIKNQSTEFYPSGLPVGIFDLYHVDKEAWKPGKGAALRSEGLHSSPSSAPHDLWDLFYLIIIIYLFLFIYLTVLGLCFFFFFLCEGFL